MVIARSGAPHGADGLPWLIGSGSGGCSRANSSVTGQCRERMTRPRFMRGRRRSFVEVPAK